MQSKPDGAFNYIGHIVDHFSKLHIMFPLMRKTASEVCKNVIERFFSVFGLPRIIHSDNGSEFVNSLIKSFVTLWPGKATFVNRNPGHSRSQGFVEQGNNTIQLMISAREQDTGSTEWSKWLPEIQCKFLKFSYLLYFDEYIYFKITFSVVILGYLSSEKFVGVMFHRLKYFVG